MKRLYCVIVTYNGMQWIEKCLNSLVQSAYPVNIIVIDNGSSDDTCSYIENNYPAVHLIRAGKNLGFGQANNRGMKYALQQGAEYVFLLNQDAWVELHTLRQLVDIQEKFPEFGLISPIHLNGNGNAPDANFLQYFRKSQIENVLGALLLNDPSSGAPVETEFVNAAAWLLTAGCIHQTGGFDNLFFHYGEDINYCQRVIYHGFKIGICLRTFIYHDREQRRKAAEGDLSIKLNYEWLNLINQLCDVRRPNYRALYVKRFLRYFFLLLKGVAGLNKSLIIFNWGIIRKLMLSTNKIKTSRRLALSSSFL